MLHELEKHDFKRALPVFDGYLQDPMLYAVIEGRRSGRVFVDQAANPTRAFVWTNSESAYLTVGQALAESQALAGDEDDVAWLQDFRCLILEEIIPQAKDIGCHFLSLFSFPNTYAETLEHLFAEQLPLRTPINTFSFDEATFRKRHGQPASLPEGFTLQRMGREVLAQSGLEDLADEIAARWGSLDAFVDEGVGYCVLHDGCVVSWCYVQAFGNKTQTIDIWTSPDHRGEALGTAAGSAVIGHCLAQGYAPFWFNDEANLPSRRLAERLGFQYECDLYLVDIPFEPYDFFRSLAIHFFFPQGRYRQAAEAYERAFSVQDGTAEDYYNAAVGWAEAGEAEKALDHLQKAIEHGWVDVAALEETAAFEPLRETEQWRGLVDGKDAET